MVGEVGDRCAPLLDAEPKGRSGVRDEICRDGKRPQLEPAGDHIVQDDPGQLAEPDREQGRRQVTGQSLGKLHRGRGGPPEVDLDIWIEQRAEETEALDVIHVEMAEEDVEPPYAIVQVVLGMGNPRTRIEQETGAIVIDHQSRRGVAAVADGGHAGPAHRPPGTEQGQLHGIRALKGVAPRTL